VEILILSTLSLFGRQWSKWEILSISLAALFVLAWMTKQQRSNKVRSKYNKDQFLDSSPLIGRKFGAQNKSHHEVKDWKKDRLAPVQKHQKKQHIQTKEPLEKPHEEIKQHQNETIKPKQAKAHLEQQVSELTAENEKLQHELARFEQAEQQIAEMAATCRQLQPEEPRVEQISEQQVAAEPAVKVPVKRKTARKSKTHEQQHRTVDGVRQKLCRKCKEWKPESEFHKSSSSKDGLAGSCKICKNNAARERRSRREAAQR